MQKKGHKEKKQLRGILRKKKPLEHYDNSSSDFTTDNTYDATSTLHKVDVFETSEVTNCDFLFAKAQSQPAPSGGSLMKKLGSMFTSKSEPRISAMTADDKHNLVLGFSNGALIILDSDSTDIRYKDPAFSNEERPIEKLQLFFLESEKVAGKIAQFLLALSGGVLSYSSYPQVSMIGEVRAKATGGGALKVHDFCAYYRQGRCLLAVITKNRTLIIFRFKKSTELSEISRTSISALPMHFCVRKETLLLATRDAYELVRFEN